MAILIADNINFKSKTVTRNKGQYILIKGSIPQEDITITSKCMKDQVFKLYKVNIDRIEGRNRQTYNSFRNFNISFLIMARTMRVKTSMERENLNNAINQLDLTQIQSTVL